MNPETGHKPEGGGGNAAPRIRLTGISKSFGPVKVLEEVTLSLAPGEVIGLLGENGAGKSTMMNIVSGGLKPDTGEILYDGAEVRFSSFAEGIEAGIAFVHQELSVVGALSVAENLFLGRMPRNAIGLVDRDKMRREAQGMLDAVGAGGIDAARLAGNLRAGEQQLVEIARAAARDPRLLILDEPTSSLTPHEVEGFLDFVRRARDAGTAIIFITHRLDEAMSICDRLLVLRNGCVVSDRRPEETTKDRIIADMTGKTALFSHAARAITSTKIALELSGVSVPGVLEDVSFSVRKGEIFGLFGLVGAGRTELLETICGARRKAAGAITLDGAPLAPRNPAEALQRGIALVPEGRKTAGILPQHSVRRNASASSLRSFARLGVVSGGREAGAVADELSALSVRMEHDGRPITTLSGGNQQKVIFARALLSGPTLLLLDEPTHGVDVGAKAEIYDIIRAAADEGLTVIVASSELPEITGLCDRVGVLSKGRLAGVLARDEMDEAEILRLAFSEHERET
ncbi:MAG: ABC transporter [Martelella sp.]|uniref:sugar ABC transporter ATP-binding protein n=1 Tax=unclassified Martelella TaxID=2629616 RepID=UPI000C5968EF|nr:sugar ABC transporter ATP-binding protein [Martelella sp.]MAU22680.1 ABC transporter [Martelella sp.]